MANKVEQLRLSLGMGRTEYAAELGVVRTTVMRWEKREATPPQYIDAALEALAKKHGHPWPLPEITPIHDTGSAPPKRARAVA